MCLCNRICTCVRACVHGQMPRNMANVTRSICALVGQVFGSLVRSFVRDSQNDLS